jgi:hypothetical protein
MTPLNSGEADRMARFFEGLGGGAPDEGTPLAEIFHISTRRWP